MEDFKIRAYGRTELAMLFCPEVGEQAAFRKLNRWIDHFPGLRGDLTAAGLTPRQRTYTPAQVRIIINALGTP